MVHLHGPLAGEQRHHVCRIWKKLGSASPLFQEVQSKSKVCANVFCGAGRECAVSEKGEPSCLCIEVGQVNPHAHLRRRFPRLQISLWHFFLSWCSRVVSPTRGQCVAVMAKPTGTTVSSTGTLVWPAWRSKWPMMDTARVGAFPPVAYP